MREVVKNREHRRTGAQSLPTASGIESLYAGALPAKRTGPLFSAFPYPTKISPEAIALFILAHTRPGETVFDGFAGSGTTGLAALLCGDPNPAMRTEAKRLRFDVRWGARNAVLYELGALGAFVGRTLTNPPEPRTFRKATEEVLAETTRDDGWMYGARDPGGHHGTIRHVIWSDLLRCTRCDREVSLWDACVSRAPAAIASRFTCPFCDHDARHDEVERLTERVTDDILGVHTQRRAREPMWLYGKTGKTRWSRRVNKDDLDLIRRIGCTPLPDAVPLVEIPWGDLYRRGYHLGITHLHHFYTRRNLILFARLWERAGAYDGRLRDALRFWLLSYNAAHATIMTRVVAKSGQKDLVVTSAQPGVLYVSGLPVEKNLIAGLRRKLSTIASAFDLIHGLKGRVEVRQQSSCQVALPDQSIDYVFTDPPFAGNIPYSEVNFLNEAWLGRYTDRADETIVSASQKKTLADYQNLLMVTLSEARRILKTDGKATLVFHSASAEVWRTLQAAYTDAGFGVVCAGILDKTQGSFKQVTTKGAVRGDPVLLLGRLTGDISLQTESAFAVAERLRQEAAGTLRPAEQTAQRLYSRLVAYYLTHRQQVPMDAESFYRWYAEQPLLEDIARVDRRHS